MTDTVRRLVVIRGRVQGVGFRWAAEHEARRLGVSGTIRNRFDGAVEAAIEGNADDVAAMETWLANGPPSAQVDSIDADDQPATGAEGFRIS